MGEKVMILWIVIVMIIRSECNASSSSSSKVYKVGGASGWTTINMTHSTYKSWAASKRFHVGDTLLFAYNKEFHNVVRVNHNNFNLCNSTAPLSSWASGNDSFSITGPGHFYFICGFPGHCSAGQKVDVRVPGHRHGPSPSPSPNLLSPAPTPPAHPPKSGSSPLSSYSNLCTFAAAIALSALVF